MESLIVKIKEDQINVAGFLQPAPAIISWQTNFRPLTDGEQPWRKRRREPKLP